MSEVLLSRNKVRFKSFLLSFVQGHGNPMTRRADNLDFVILAVPIAPIFNAFIALDHSYERVRHFGESEILTDADARPSIEPISCQSKDPNSHTQEMPTGCKTKPSESSFPSDLG